MDKLQDSKKLLLAEVIGDAGYRFETKGGHEENQKRHYWLATDFQNSFLLLGPSALKASLEKLSKVIIGHFL